MSTYTQILYQIVFGTKHRERTMIKKSRPELFQYIAGLLKNKGCHLYRINGVEDHLHIITHIHPSLSLATLVKDIKLSTTKLIKEKNLFPNFAGWQDGYGAFTYHTDALNNLIEYVKNQEEHHRIKTFEKEYKELLENHKIEFDDAFLF
ncbi:MAG: IS200/IS605 family transposase [Chitinophagaceae bacterium]